MSLITEYLDIDFMEDIDWNKIGNGELLTKRYTLQSLINVAPLHSNSTLKCAKMFNLDIQTPVTKKRQEQDVLKASRLGSFRIFKLVVKHHNFEERFQNPNMTRKLAENINPKMLKIYLNKSMHPDRAQSNNWYLGAILKDRIKILDILMNENIKISKSFYNNILKRILIQGDDYLNKNVVKWVKQNLSMIIID